MYMGLYEHVENGQPSRWGLDISFWEDILNFMLILLTSIHVHPKIGDSCMREKQARPLRPLPFSKQNVRAGPPIRNSEWLASCLDGKGVPVWVPPEQFGACEHAWTLAPKTAEIPRKALGGRVSFLGFGSLQDCDNSFGSGV